MPCSHAIKRNTSVGYCTYWIYVITLSFWQIIAALMQNIIIISRLWRYEVPYRYLKLSTTFNWLDLLAPILMCYVKPWNVTHIVCWNQFPTNINTSIDCWWSFWWTVLLCSSSVVETLPAFIFHEWAARILITGSLNNTTLHTRLYRIQSRIQQLHRVKRITLL